MSSLLLIRHGQASFMEENYDQLSGLGQEQARCLGQFLVRSEIVFDQVITGPRQRQKGTSQIVVDCYRSAGLGCPPLEESHHFDEHQLEQLLRHHRKNLPLPLSEPGLNPTPSDPRALQRDFYKVLEAAATRWLEAHASTETVESWRDFKARVQKGLAHIMERGGRGRRIAVFTSAGVIGVALQQALGCSDLQAMQLSWRLRNASLNEFVFSGPRFTVDSFNGLPHLPDRKSWTYV